MAAQEYLYLLQLEHDKWFLGKTSGDVKAQYEKHVRGEAGTWTKMFRPLKLAEVRKCKSEADERVWVEALMKQYGINEVRGGPYVSVDLPEQQYESLQQKFRHIDNTCYHCKKAGHYIKTCPFRRHRQQDDEDSDDDADEFEGDFCWRCRRPGHYKQVCTARTDIDGSPLP